jgi:hypothetical protein
MVDAVLRGLGITDADTYCGYELYRFWQGANEYCETSP